jgi:hypothetical protein
MPRRRALLSFAFVLLVAAWVVAAVVSGTDTGLLYLAPALTLCAPLLLGRYVGEHQLATLAGTSPAKPRRHGGRVAAPRSHVRVMHRGGRLVASSLAKRPPPAVAPFVIA